MSRPSFHAINMQYALSLAERSTCVRGIKVGTVITTTDFRRVLAIGYNGNASGLDNTCDLTGPEAVGKCGCLHSEENAVINCTEPRGTAKIVFCTHLPCVMCAKRLINLGGVMEVYFRNDYRNRDSLKLFDRVGIRFGWLKEGDAGAAIFSARLLLLPTGESTTKSSSPLLCEHANECPRLCPCRPECYCKSHSCVNREAL